MIRIITAALVALALAAPVATAMPIREAAGVSSQSPQQDLRSPDRREAAVVETVPAPPTWPVDPEPIATAAVEPASVTGDDGTSPLVYILPGVLVSILLVAGMAYAVRMSRRARVGA